MLRRLGVSAKSTALSKMPTKALRRVFSDKQAERWERKADEAEKSRDNAMRVFHAQARVTTAKNQIGVAAYAFGMGAIQSDRDAALVKQAIHAHSRTCNPDRFLAVEEGIRGLLG